MNRTNVKEFLREVLGGVELTDHPNWVGVRCPFAPWKHANGRDENASSGVSVKEDGLSIFSCFSCHTRGPLSFMVKHLDTFTGEDHNSLIASLSQDEFFGGELPDWGRAASKTILEPLSKEIWLNVYDELDPNHPYLARRHIRSETAIQLGLLHDPADSEGDERILFPVYDRNWNLYGFTGRAIKNSARLKVRDYQGLPKRALLLGEQLIENDCKFVVLTEGLFDYATLRQCGYNALAFMSSTVTDEQVQRLIEIGKPIIFFHDNDDAGRDAREKAKELLWNHLPISKVRYPKRNLRNRRTNQIRQVKDPNELKEGEIHQMVQNAILMV